MTAAIIANLEKMLGGPRDGALLRHSLGSELLKAGDAEDDSLTFGAEPLPSGLSLDPATGIISGTVAPDAASTQQVTLSVSDGLASSQKTITWTILDGTDELSNSVAHLPGKNGHIERRVLDGR